MDAVAKYKGELSAWCDNEIERCKRGIAAMQSSDTFAYKQPIANYYLEISMYQSFKNKISQK